MLFEEIYGCVKYIGMPYDTIINMPIQYRKFWINRHNLDIQKIKEKEDNKKSGSVITEKHLINNYAETEMNRMDLLN